MAKLNTIILDMPMSFECALNYMLEGKCMGIKPKTTTGYIELYFSKDIARIEENYLLRWAGSQDDSSIRVENYIGEWFPVIANHLELRDETKKS